MQKTAEETYAFEESQQGQRRPRRVVLEEPEIIVAPPERKNLPPLEVNAFVGIQTQPSEGGAHGNRSKRNKKAPNIRRKAQQTTSSMMDTDPFLYFESHYDLPSCTPNYISNHHGHTVQSTEFVLAAGVICESDGIKRAGPASPKARRPRSSATRWEVSTDRCTLARPCALSRSHLNFIFMQTRLEPTSCISSCIGSAAHEPRSCHENAHG